MTHQLKPPPSSEHWLAEWTRRIAYVNKVEQATYKLSIDHPDHYPYASVHEGHIHYHFDDVEISHESNTELQSLIQFAQRELAALAQSRTREGLREAAWREMIQRMEYRGPARRNGAPNMEYTVEPGFGDSEETYQGWYRCVDQFSNAIGLPWEALAMPDGWMPKETE